MIIQHLAAKFMRMKSALHVPTAVACCAGSKWSLSCHDESCDDYQVWQQSMMLCLAADCGPQ